MILMVRYMAICGYTDCLYPSGPVHGTVVRPSPRQGSSCVTLAMARELGPDFRRQSLKIGENLLCVFLISPGYNI